MLMKENNVNQHCFGFYLFMMKGLFILAAMIQVYMSTNVF